MIIRIAVYVIATLLIAAHFLRVDSAIGVALCLATPILFIVRQRWSLLILQLLAYIAAAIWLGLAWRLVAARWSVGQPWLLATAILVTVAAFSGLAGGLLRSRNMWDRYCNK
jgi:hypothetical protein